MEKVNVVPLELHGGGISAVSGAMHGEHEAALDLESIAYENVHAPVFHACLKLDRPRRQQALRDRYIFYSYAFCVGTYVGELVKLDFEKANLFAAETLEDVLYLVQARISYTEEWFKGIDRLVGALTGHHFLPEARSLVAVGLRTGVARFPQLAQSLSVHAAYLDALVGRREKAANVALRLVHKPYLLPNRRELPALCYRIMNILAAGSHLREYRLVLWTGVTNVMTKAPLGDIFADQIVKTYRGGLRAILHGDVPFKYRIPFFFANVARVISRTPVLGRLRLDLPWRWTNFVVLQFLSRFVFKKNELFREANRLATPFHEKQKSRRRFGVKLPARFSTRKRKKILVTRAMGGIGDLMTMTPGLQTLAKRFPQSQIDFAIPKSFHSIFEGLPQVRLLDIGEDKIDISSYKRWVNLTDCPAGRAESRQYPNVKRNRIESFALAMGQSRARVRSATNFTPYYRVEDAEKEWGRQYISEINPSNLPVIGLQPISADSYKNWPYMTALAERLAKDHLVLVFHHEDLLGFDSKNVVKVLAPLRKSIALLSLCEKLVGVDSSFVHIAAALNVKTLAIFGPTSGQVISRYYPNVKYLAPAKSEFPCSPCWRNEHKPCHLTSGRESICLRAIEVDSVVDSLNNSVAPWKERSKLSVRAKTWFFYGTD